VEELKSFFRPLKNSYNPKSHDKGGILKNQYKLLAKAIIIENNEARTRQEGQERSYIKYNDCVRRAQDLGVNFVYRTKTNDFRPVSDTIAKRAMLTAQTRYINYFRNQYSYTYESLKSQHSLTEMLAFLKEHGKQKKFKLKDVVEMDEILTNIEREDLAKEQIKKANELLDLIWVCKVFNPFLPPVYGVKDVEGWSDLDGLLIS